MSARQGALPMHLVSDMIDAGFIRNARKENLRPSSIDLRLSEEMYRVEGIFLPRPGESIRNILKQLHATPHNLAYPLERDVMYLAKLEESLDLPDHIYGYCNPRSSTGRNDILVRVLADGISRYDSINEPGFKGELWAVISPKSYPVLLQPDLTLSQLRLFTGDGKLDELSLELSFEKDQLLWEPDGRTQITYKDLPVKDRDGSILLSSHLVPDEGIVGWECLGSNQVMDFTKDKNYQPEDFYTPIVMQKPYIHLRKNGFYILKTKEFVKVPNHLACEMIPMDERSGEFRTHYAGFIDPGWGTGQNNEGRGRSLVLEVRPFEDMILRDNQPVGKILFERMHEVPDKGYDELSVSNYNIPFGPPKLSRHFIMDEYEK